MKLTPENKAAIDAKAALADLATAGHFLIVQVLADLTVKTEQKIVTTIS